MKRRLLLKLFGLLTILSLGRFSSANQDEALGLVEFFVAGLRFHDPEPLKVGDTVSVCAELFEGAIAYAVLTSGEQRIGFAPKSLVPKLSGQKVYTGTIVQANRFAVPWKRYRVQVNG